MSDVYNRDPENDLTYNSGTGSYVLTSSLLNPDPIDESTTVKELAVNSTVYDIVGKGILDQNSKTTQIEWFGTKAEYDALGVYADHCTYYITDDAGISKEYDLGHLTEIINDFDVNAFKPEVDAIKNSAISDINEATSNSVEQLKNMGEVVNYTNITNCITEIPQDIKLKYSGNTLILKAGSKTYIPNGTGVFDEVVIANDISLSISTDTVCAIGYNRNANTIYNWALSDCYSGTTEPSASYALWYDTTNNLVKQKIDGVITNSVSLPIATITVSNGAISSIDQVFNGFGYIGSTVFALPGVKGLIPDGRNPDGTLNNIKCTTSQVATLTVNGNRRIHVAIRDNGTLGRWNTSGTRYDANQNFNYYNDFIQYCAVVGKFDVSNGQIQNFRPYNTFHAVDYNSGDYVIDFQAPTADNSYTWYRKYKSGWVEQGGVFDAPNNTAGVEKTITLPLPMTNDKYTITIGVRNTTNDYDVYLFVATKTSTTITFKCNIANAALADQNWQVSGMSA